MFKSVNIKLFSIAIGIEEPWEIYDVKLDEKKDLHIYVKFKRGTKFECKECGKKCNIHDTVEKTWRHLNFFEHKAFIHAKVPRITCDKHKTHLVEVPWAKRQTGFTTQFEEFVMALAKKMSVLSVTKIVKESYGRIWRIIRKYADEYIENIDCSVVTQIGLDETSKKGHDYITVFIDLKTSRVIYISDGKSSSTIEEFNEWIMWALKSKIDELKKVAKTIKSKMRGITNYFHSRLTNAVLEDTNSMIQNIKSRARGYKDSENFKAMIYLMNSENRVVG